MKVILKMVLKAGKGVKYFENGDKYDGDWEEDDFNGNGVFIIKMEINMLENLKEV